MSLETARAIAETVREAGGRALIVGGWVRDRLLGQLPPKDLDLEIFHVPQEKLPPLIAPFGRVEPVGQSFPVYKVVRPGEGDIDVTLPRRESKRGRGHKAFDVVGDPSMSVRDASRRRDFTINAIAWDPLTETYEDPFDGQSDLRRRILRAVDPSTFGDDSLRVLRAIQFAARFECTLDAESAALCSRIPLDDLPAERIWGEIEKLLLQAARPSIGLTLARDLGVVEQAFPRIEGADLLRAGTGMASRGGRLDAYLDGGGLGADNAIVDLARPQQVTVMLGAVCHDFGKPADHCLDRRKPDPAHSITRKAGVAPTDEHFWID